MDDINIPYPLYTTLVQNPQVKSPIIYTSSSKLNPENTMVNDLLIIIIFEYLI